MPFPAIVRIESPRLTLRPVLASDLADLLEVNGDPQVTRFLPYPAWQSLEDGGAWLSRMEALGASGTGRQLVLVAKPDSRVIGTLLLFRFDEASSRLELGYALARNHWGQGFMKEAVEAACSHAFGELNIRRIEAEVNPANAASCRLLLNAGFALEGNLRQRWVVKGVTYDTCIYGCLAEDWRRKRSAR